MAYDVKAFNLSWPAVPDATYYKVGEDVLGTSNYELIAEQVAQNSYRHANLALTQPPSFWRYAIKACNANGCSAYSRPVNPDANKAIGYFKAPGADSPWYGNAMALSGDGRVMAVSSYIAKSKGEVYVYTRDEDGQWSYQTTLSASNGDLGDDFGFALALSEDGATLAVSAPHEDSSASGIDGDKLDNQVQDSGALYVFTRTGSTWTERSYIKRAKKPVTGSLGYAVAISADGSSIVAGVPEESAAYVFKRSGGSWTEQRLEALQSIGISNGFGIAAAISPDGSTTAIGATGDQSGVVGDPFDRSANNAGAAYVFGLSAGNWVQQAYLKAAQPLAEAGFGISVGLSRDGGTLAIGAWQERLPGIASGAAYVFTRTGGTYMLAQRLLQPNPRLNGSFGRCVALSADGMRLAVSAVSDRTISVGVNGSVETGDGAAAGAVQTFDYNSGDWQPKAFVKAPNPDQGDTFGGALNLSYDGKVMGVGASTEQSAARGINGTQTDNSSPNSGAAYLY